MIRNYTNYKKVRTYRVIVPYVNGNYGIGSGFFITKELFLTCFHVAFGKELKSLVNDPEYVSSLGQDQKTKLQSYFKSHIKGIEIEISDASRETLTLKDFNENYDIVLLQTTKKIMDVNICDLDFDKQFRYGNTLNFFGFPIHHAYQLDQVPIAYQEGFFSAYVKDEIGGGRYEHVQMNSINLGGNSGAPVFSKNSKKVVGIINGNMNWGNDYIVSMPPNNQNQLRVDPFRVPLSIAYFTSVKTIKENTTLFDSLNIPIFSYSKFKNVIKRLLHIG